MPPGVGTIRWGDDDVPLLSRTWPPARGVIGYRKTYALRPGQRWQDAPVSARQYEHLVQVNGEPVPVGVAIAREIVAAGADWAYCTELWAGRLVLLNIDAVCVEPNGPVGELMSELRTANGGGLGGLPDVVGRHGTKILLREAKLSLGRDRLRSSQHRFLRSQRRAFGDRIDAAIVEWDIPDPSKLIDPERA